MEHNALTFPVMILTSILFSVFMYLVMKMLKRSKNDGSGLNLPPGPWKLPLIGNVHNLIGSLPHHRLTDLAKKHGRHLMHLKLGEVSTVVVSTAEAAKEVMKTHDIIFANRPKIFAASITTYDYTDIAFAPYGEYWRQLRKICVLELLSAKRVQSFRCIREEEIEKLVNSVKSNADSPVDICKVIYAYTYNVTSKAAFGKVWTGKDVFMAAVKKIIEAAEGFSIVDLYPSIKFLHHVSGIRPKLERQFRIVDTMLGDIINEHKARRSENKVDSDSGEEVDLVDVLLNVQEHGDLPFPLTINNIKAVVTDLFIAGIDTSSTTTAWAMSEIMKHPEVLEKAQAELRQVFGNEGIIEEQSLHELKYLKLIIKETFRLHPPVPLLLPRENREHCRINGFDIPMKSKIIVNVYAMGRDPGYWDEPEKFIPERFSNNPIDYKGTHFEFIPFGAGRRMCPGLLFGIANVELALSHLLYHFDWKLPDGMNPEDLDMTEAFGAVVMRKSELQLVPTPYLPLK